MWTDEKIREALTQLTRELGHHPSSPEIRNSSHKGLDGAIGAHEKKHNGWRLELGAKVRSNWTETKIEKELRRESKAYDRMPTNPELSSKGRDDLSNAIRRSGGFRHWALKLGLELKKCETHRSYDIEVWVKKKLESLGHSAEMTTTKTSYDLLVDSSIRVEVKMARVYLMYGIHVTYIFAFGANPEKRNIDFSVLVCVNEDDKPVKTYILPKRFCQQQTISITRSHRWKPFLEAWDLIE